MNKNNLLENQQTNFDEKEENKFFYELAFFLSPQLTENEVENFLNELKEWILKNEGEVIYNEPWRLQKIAYPIKKSSEGYFSFVQFQFKKEKIGDLKEKILKDKKILRSLLIKLNPKEDVVFGLEEKKPEFKPKANYPKKVPSQTADGKQSKEPEGKEISLEELEKKIEEILKQ
ncbi:MAG: 30S ribosomal protein S6 [Minisyncoccia bacterium]